LADASIPLSRGRFGIRLPLFRKYVAVIVGLVAGALLVSGVVQTMTTVSEGQSSLARFQHEKAVDAAFAIEQYLQQFRRELAAAGRPQSQSLAQRRLDFNRLMAMEPAIVDLTYYDPQGREELMLSRVELDRERGGMDMSTAQMFIQAKAGQTYIGPIFFRHESEPYLTMALRDKSEGGVIAASINLKSVLEVISGVRIGTDGYAYVVDSNGRLIAHKDMNLVLRKADLSQLPQVVEALGELTSPTLSKPDAVTGVDLAGERVLAAHKVIPSLNWVVFVQQPLAEAYAPIVASWLRSLGVLLFGVAVSILAALMLARGLVRPIRVLQQGAERIASGDLEQRISVQTGDEIEALANDFNRMTARLNESYSQLEHKVEERTRELRESLERQTALTDVLQLISRSTFDLQSVMRVLLERTVQLCDAQVGMIYRRTPDGLELIALHPSNAELESQIREAAGRLDQGSFAGRVDHENAVINLADIAETMTLTDNVSAFHVRLGLKAALGVPLVQLALAATDEESDAGRPRGVMTIFRHDRVAFADGQIQLAQAFADQAAITIENVRLAGEVEEKTRQVEELRIEIDHAMKSKQVNEIVSTDFFQDLQGKAQQLRQRHTSRTSSPGASSLLSRVGQPPTPSE
jgi:methyl-accepting chemotaxis protein